MTDLELLARTAGARSISWGLVPVTLHCWRVGDLFNCLRGNLEAFRRGLSTCSSLHAARSLARVDGSGVLQVRDLRFVLADLLGNEGLVRLTPANEPFDPNLHDAVMHEEGDGGEPTVIETLRTGYQWKSRVLRPAMVKVKG